MITYKRLKNISVWVILLFSIGISTSALGQEEGIELRGSVVNSVTGEAIPFVNLGVEGTTLGVASNEHGLFVLEVPKVIFKEFKLSVSVIGFEPKMYVLSSLSTEKDNVIRLNPIEYTLESFDVQAESKVLYGIIKNAAKHIEDNYYIKPLKYQFSYKQVLKNKGKVKENKSFEGVITDSLGYRNKSYKNAYRSIGYQFNKGKAPVTNLQVSPWFDDLLSYDIVKNKGNVLSVEHLNKYHLDLVAKTTLDGDSVYVIHYKNLYPDMYSTSEAYVSEYEGTIIVELTSFAVLRNSINIKTYKRSRFGKDVFVNTSKTMLGKDVTLNIETEYKKTNNIYAVRSIQLKSSYTNETVMDAECKLTIRKTQTVTNPTSLKRNTVN